MGRTQVLLALVLPPAPLFIFCFFLSFLCNLLVFAFVSLGSLPEIIVTPFFGTLLWKPFLVPFFGTLFRTILRDPLQILIGCTHPNSRPSLDLYPNTDTNRNPNPYLSFSLLFPPIHSTLESPSCLTPSLSSTSGCLPREYATISRSVLENLCAICCS